MSNAQEMIDTCVQCGNCTEVCPFYKATGNQAFGAMAKVEAARSLFSEEDLSDDMLKTLFLCTRCDRCKSVCPVDISVPEIIQVARTMIRKRGLWPQKCINIAKAIIEHGSPMAAPPHDRVRYLPVDYKPPEKAEYLYIPGCWAGVKLPETAKATFQLLSLAGLDFTVVGDKEGCCGLFLIDNGMMDEARAMAEKNTLLFESTEAKVIIAECPACYDVYKSVYPALFRKPNYEVAYISEILEDLIGSGKIKVHGSGKKVIFKDPCPLVRRYDMIESPRNVLASVAEVVEFEEHGRDAVCCGAPAGVKPLYPEIANKLAEILLDEASSKNITQVGVGCAFCMYHMSGVLKGPQDPRSIKTLSQLVLENADTEQ